MWLYRVMSMSRSKHEDVFQRATASSGEAIRLAEAIERRDPSQVASVTAENWPQLGWWRFQYHRLMGTHEGFGEQFKDKHGLAVTEQKLIWPYPEA